MKNIIIRNINKHSKIKCISRKHEWGNIRCVANMECFERLFYQCKKCGQGASVSGRTILEEERCFPVYYTKESIEEIKEKLPDYMTWFD